MKNSRIIVYVLCLISCICSLLFGRALYQFVMNKRAQLQKPTHVADIKRGNSIPVSILGFKHFYELQPNHEWVDTTAWLGLNPLYQINNDGFNGLKNYSIQVPSDTYRIMTIGDSFTFGQFVNTPDNFSEKLSVLLQNTSCGKKKLYEVINLGVPGYDIGYTVAHFLHKGQQYNPDLVIWLINTHNVISREYIISRLIEVEADIPDGVRKPQESASAFYDQWLKAQEDVIRMYGKDALMDVQQGYIETFMKTYTGPLLVVVNNNVEDPDYLAFVSKVFGQRKHTTVDYRFPNLQNATFEDAHPNVEGHARIASYMYSLFKDHIKDFCTE